jgi:hypothetical protein
VATDGDGADEGGFKPDEGAVLTSIGESNTDKSSEVGGENESAATPIIDDANDKPSAEENPPVAGAAATPRAIAAAAPSATAKAEAD